MLQAKVAEVLRSTPYPSSNLIYPLNAKSDEHLISPYNITPKSNTKVMRMKEMITNKKLLVRKQILLVSTLGYV